MPFGEPMLLRIASAYERATHHWMSPPEFGPLEEKKWSWISSAERGRKRDRDASPN